MKAAQAELEQQLRDVLQNWNTGFTNVELSQLLITLAVNVADEGDCLDVSNTPAGVNFDLQRAFTIALDRDWR